MLELLPETLQGWALLVGSVVVLALTVGLIEERVERAILRGRERKLLAAAAGRCDWVLEGGEVSFKLEGLEPRVRRDVTDCLLAVLPRARERRTLATFLAAG